MPASLEELGLEPVNNMDIYRHISLGYTIARQAIENNLHNSFAQTKEIYAANIFNSCTFVPQTPHIWIPKLTLPEVALVGVAAAMVKNPLVTRRFWQGWFNEGGRDAS